MDLFEYNRRGVLEREAPLASRMRPRTLDEVVGQEHIIGPDRLLSRAIRADRIGSLILYGPPGTGKTTIAQVIANTTHSRFVQINATTAGKKDMEDAVQKARDALGMEERRTILFVDEIHRFNKAQQDYLLPFVEDGTVTLIGATTENPYFEVNRALVSRSRIFELKPLCQQDLERLLRRALSDPERGLGRLNVDADDDLITLCFCDDRRTEDVYEDAFGDDWNDTPYEHNAGIVSDRFEDVEIVVKPHGGISVTYPHEGHCNSDWCRDDMKTGIVPLAVTVPDSVVERYGDDWRLESGYDGETCYEYVVGMKGANRVYFGDMLFPVLGAIRKCADIVDVIVVSDGWRNIARKHNDDIDGVTDDAFKPKRFEIEEL